MKRLCTICARGGSKGVKGKNLMTLAGKPLLVHSIQQAFVSGLFDTVAVSSDSDEILGMARRGGNVLLVRRPLELATDHAPKIPAIRHCALEVEQVTGEKYDTIVDLDATSPLRDVRDIAGAIKLLEESGCSNVITGTPARRSPYFNLVELDREEVVNLSKPLPVSVARRQDSPPCFDMNASIYVWQRGVLMEKDTVFNRDTRLFVMPEERSVDIDSELDLQIVEFLLARRTTGAGNGY